MKSINGIANRLSEFIAQEIEHNLLKKVDVIIKEEVEIAITKIQERIKIEYDYPPAEPQTTKKIALTENNYPQPEPEIKIKWEKQPKEEYELSLINVDEDQNVPPPPVDEPLTYEKLSDSMIFKIADLYEEEVPIEQIIQTLNVQPEAVNRILQEWSNAKENN